MTDYQKIIELKKEKDTVILAHYYVNSEVQEVADYIGDSFYLSKVAKKLENKRIVFAGVKFMGESARILNPDKIVLMPDAGADCPMAHMVTEEEVMSARAQYKDLAVVCYINSTARIKSWSDVCVTSANAVDIVRNIPQKNILFIPDKNLGRYVKEMVPEKNVMLVKGYCPVHEKMAAQEIKELMEAHPDAKVLVHPECNDEVMALCDYAGSTSGIISFVEKNGPGEYIIGTEIGVLAELKKRSPESSFYFTKTPPVCEDMKMVTLEKLIKVLENDENQVELDENVSKKARGCLDKMLEYGK